ncbi:MAG: hypothetical protein HY294_04235 [Candidatus Rokubacteria bacterium]|nr:hypothetical protein [Candidatus Rokubacteria bacterium]MBI3825184.1 hypothetical protein [Candidatus Rokubacteria bacterium]
MSSHRLSVLLLGGVLLAATGCATGEEWATWKSHGAHFASAKHMGFSLRNTEGGTPRVTRTDVALARDEAWWGKPITVGQEQILER